MKNSHNYHKYLIHTFLHKFTEKLFFVFGSLLLYTKTESLLYVLLFFLTAKATSIFIRSVGLPLFFGLIKRFSMYVVLNIAVVFMAISFISLFYIPTSSTSFIYIFLGVAILKSVSNSIYVIISNTIMFNEIGLSNLPGKYTALVSIVQTSGGILSVLLGIFLNLRGDFLFLFIIAGVMLFGSVLPLRGMKLPTLHTTSFKKCFCKLSSPAILANINPSHTLQVVGLPLIIMLVFTSINTSIWISAIAAIATMIISYVTGSFKDGRKKYLNKFALVLFFIVWIWYGFANSEIQFIFLGIVGGLAATIIRVGRNARLSREITNTKQPLESTIAIEFSRGIGGFLGVLTLFIAYSITNTLPQMILVLGALFMLPKAIYAIGNIDGKKKR